MSDDSEICRLLTEIRDNQLEMLRGQKQAIQVQQESAARQKTIFRVWRYAVALVLIAVGGLLWYGFHLGQELRQALQQPAPPSQPI